MAEFTKDDLKLGKEHCRKASTRWHIIGGSADYAIIRSGTELGFLAKVSRRDDINFILHARTAYPRALAALGEAWAKIDILWHKVERLQTERDIALEQVGLFRAAEEPCD